jgi:hypothetical protein
MNRTLLVRSSVRVVRLASFANAAFAIAVTVGLAASLLMGDRLTAMLFRVTDGADMLARTHGARWTLLLGLALAAAIHVFLDALGRILATVATGDPFVEANAARLRTIGWSLLALQLLDAPAALIGRAYPVLERAAPYADPSPAGWLAVLLAFVLAHVFAAGSRMRDDLEGTV